MVQKVLRRYRLRKTHYPKDNLDNELQSYLYINIILVCTMTPVWRTDVRAFGLFLCRAVGNAVSHGSSLPVEAAGYVLVEVEYVVPTLKSNHPSPSDSESYVEGQRHWRQRQSLGR